MTETTFTSHRGEGPKAIIYCRVASVAQRTDSNALALQEQRCREHAASKGYVVVKVAHDIAVSGMSLDRPGLQDVLGYLGRESASSRHVLIVDDIARLSRDAGDYIQLRNTLSAAGVQVEFGASAQDRGMDESPVPVTLVTDKRSHQDRGPRR